MVDRGWFDHLFREPGTAQSHLCNLWEGIPPINFKWLNLVVTGIMALIVVAGTGI